MAFGKSRLRGRGRVRKIISIRRPSPQVGGKSMLAPKTRVPSSPSTPRLAALVMAGMVAAAPIVGCTTEEDSSTGTGGSGGGHYTTAAGADSGAALDGGAPDAGAQR